MQKEEQPDLGDYLNGVREVHSQLAGVAAKREPKALDLGGAEPVIMGEDKGWITIEIPSHLQPTVFVVKPGTQAPTMTHVAIHRSSTENEWVICLEMRKEYAARDLILIRHVSKLRCTGKGEAEWLNSQVNAVVVGWESPKLKPAFIDFIKSNLN